MHQQVVEPKVAVEVGEEVEEWVDKERDEEQVMN